MEVRSLFDMLYVEDVLASVLEVIVEDVYDVERLPCVVSSDRVEVLDEIEVREEDESVLSDDMLELVLEDETDIVDDEVIVEEIDELVMEAVLVEEEEADPVDVVSEDDEVKDTEVLDVSVEDIVDDIVEDVVLDVLALAAFMITSAAFSAMMKIGAWMNVPGIRGNTDASTTRRPFTPLTSKFEFRTAIGSLSAPIGHVQEAW